MAEPRLSVVLPVYNGAATLPATLESLAAQEGLSEIEAIAVDQGSSDASRVVLAGFAERLPLRVIRSPETRNWMETTNVGLAAARAPLVSMLHQDDLWRPGRAMAAIAAAERAPEARLWLHAADFVDPAGRRIGRFGPPFGRARVLPGDEALETLLVQNTVALPAATFRTEEVRALGGLSTALWYTADWDLWLRLARLGPVAWDPARRAAFRLHAGAQTVTRSHDLADFEAQLRAPFEAHRGALGEAARARVAPLTEASREINLALAARFHGVPRPLGPLLGALARLGPHRLPALLARSQILARVVPRLRAGGLRRPPPGAA